MAIHQEQIVEMSGGFSKDIDAGAVDLMFDVLQKHQYQWPIKSTIREVVSNSLDSIREKNVAKSILTGMSKVEDHYINKEGAIYKDSQFNPEYYQLEFLSDDKNDVEITYRDGGDMGKDTVVIQDYGVALGGTRLQGYFNLGYSTKRLNKFALGKFGLGAKSPLSTGTAYYTLTTRWNGMEFSFNIYGHKVDPLIPKYDLDRMVENPCVHFKGYTEIVTTVNEQGETVQETRPKPVYYRRTTEKNTVIIELPVKKHHKQQYLDAVKHQLLYFDNVRLFVEEEGLREEIPIKANIMYEDDMIVMSTNAPYSKPHLLLNGVNYGYIDFRELELEEKLGNIGIKVDPEKVSINPSRESLIWDDVTREVIVNRFQEVVNIAETTINAKLSTTDFLEWLKVCANAHSVKGLFKNAEADGVIARLASIVDMSKVELKYPLNKKIRYSPYLFDGMRVSMVQLESTRQGSKTLTKVAYSPSFRSALEKNLPILYMRENFSNRKNRYLLKHIYPQGFMTIRLDYDNVEGGILPEHITNIDSVLETFDARLKGDQNEMIQRGKQRLADMHNYLYAAENIIWYEQVEVPDSFKASDEDVEEEVEEEHIVATKEARQSAAERRKLEGKIVVSTTSGYGGFSIVEFPVNKVDTWDAEEIYWGNQDSEELLSLARKFHVSSINVTNDSMREEGYDFRTDYHAPSCKQFVGSDLMLLKISQANTKYFRDFKHITRFYQEIRNKTITMSNVLVRWNTARLIQERLSELEFMNGLERIDPERHAKYKSIVAFVDANKSRLNHSDLQETLISHLDNVSKFQLFVRENPNDTETIAALARRMFNPSPGVEIEDGYAIETWVYDLYNELLDWASPVKTMLNMVELLTDGKGLSDDQEQEIRSYFEYRKVPL